MQHITYFRNGLKCGPHHNHGASCAVDVLLDTFYHGIYCSDQQLDIDKTTGMVQRLDATCEVRQQLGTPSCELREEFWNWCVEELPQAFAPKGRGDAEILEGFIALAESARSCIEIQSERHCPICTSAQINATCIPLISLTHTCNERSG